MQVEDLEPCPLRLRRRTLEFGVVIPNLLPFICLQHSPHAGLDPGLLATALAVLESLLI